MNEIKRFNEYVTENKEALEEIKAIGNDIEKIVAFANSKGFKFTVADLQAQAKNNDELSEEQLDKVAGGVIFLSGIFNMVLIF